MPEGSKGDGRRRLSPLPGYALVRVLGGDELAIRFLFERGKCVRDAGGIVAVKAGDGATAGSVLPIVDDQVGQMRQQVAAHRAQGRCPSHDHQAILGDQPRRHVAADLWPPRIVGA